MKTQTAKQQLLQSYLHAISLLLLHEEKHIKQNILERMVAFALKNHEGNFLEQWQLSKALSIMKDKELKYKLVHRHTIGVAKNGKKLFSIYDEESAELAENIISEFGHDKELTDKLEESLNIWRVENVKKLKSDTPHWSETVLV